MVRSFRETTHLFSTNLILVVDSTDPHLGEYIDIPGRHMAPSGGKPLAPPDAVHVMVLRADETGNLTKATNSAAKRVWDDDVIIGHVGDDHLFRTPGWDQRMSEALPAPGIAYGNDLNVREFLPTAPFISSIIPRSLGWYALPSCAHMYIDNAWKQLGLGLGRLHYLPDVIIEHMHPSVRKARDDEGYVRANASWEADRLAFESWYSLGLSAQLQTLRNSIG
jgi:hypothetical protein